MNLNRRTKRYTQAIVNTTAKNFMVKSFKKFFSLFLKSSLKAILQYTKRTKLRRPNISE